ASRTRSSLMPLAATTPVAGSASQWWRCLRPQSRLEPLPSLAYGRRWLRRPIWRCTGRHRRVALRRASLSREAAEPAITDPSDIEQLLAANRAPLSKHQASTDQVGEISSCPAYA